MAPFLSEEQEALAADIASLLTERRETLAVAESTAGGLISAALLMVPGAIYMGLLAGVGI
ncbi:MAG: CinA family protein, partial [Dehalococcoidia bacterium]